MRRPAAAIVAVLALALVAGCGQRATEARLLLDDIAAGYGPSELKAATPAPNRRAVSWTIDGRPGDGHLYTNGVEALGRLVLVPGLSEQGIDDSRLVALAQSLTRARFVVLVPDLARLRQFRVAATDAREIADAAAALATMAVPEAAPGPVGVAAVSYAVAPAVLAALEPDMADTVAFVVGIGGYHDIVAAVTYVTTGRYRDGPDAPWRTGRPNPVAKWWFAELNAYRLGDPADRDGLTAIARRRRTDPAAAIDDLRARLGPDGRSMLALLENTDPDATPALIAALPRRLQADFSALSPANRDLTRLRARLILIHGRDDPAIPATESVALAAAVPDGHADLYVLGGLDHVDLLERPGLFDRLALWRASCAVLAERDRIVPADAVLH